MELSRVQKLLKQSLILMHLSGLPSTFGTVLQWPRVRWAHEASRAHIRGGAGNTCLLTAVFEVYCKSFMS